MTRSAIPPSWYWLDRHFRTEREIIFGSSWMIGFDRDELAGNFNSMTLELAGESLIVTHVHHQDVCVLANVCAHRGYPLASGKGTKTTLSCPYHGWTYTLDGRRLGSGDPGLQRLGLLRMGPLYFVALSDHVSAAPFGALKDKLSRYEGFTRQAVVSRPVAANWKLVVENFNECLHCPFVHRTTLAPFVRLDDYTFQMEDDHVIHGIYSPLRPGEGESSQASGVSLRETYWLFPASAVTLGPDYLVTFGVNPLAPDRSYITRNVYTTEGTDIQSLVRYHEVLLDEDIAIVERLQSNMRSRYAKPIAITDQEPAVAHFHHLLRRSLGSSIEADALEEWVAPGRLS